ncbi:hypothetical protein [Streptomyces sp. BRA346]|uniref:hypothetical protein n=1 Tax=Streptomyces sp. BRA346 TaxID=2878199 RepID=UPI004064BD38
MLAAVDRPSKRRQPSSRQKIRESSPPRTTPGLRRAHHRDPAQAIGFLRHLAATLALTHGVELTIVSKTLRHSTISTRANIYGHLIKPAARQAVDAIAQRLDHEENSRVGGHLGWPPPARGPVEAGLQRARVQAPGLAQRVGIDLDHRVQERVDAFDALQVVAGDTPR